MRVLLVEDDYAVSQSIETMLKKEGMVVDATDLGEDGWILPRFMTMISLFWI